MRFLLIISSIFVCIVASAQKIVDATDKHPIHGAIVQLMDAQFNTLDYAITNNDGDFVIRKNEKGVFIRFNAMNYRTDTINVSQMPQIIELIVQPHELSEVVVTAPKITTKGDTLSYNVNSFAGVTDRSIGDVLARMPGIDIAKNGEIKYNGVSINKFYIEGADMMDNRYGIATNSISFQDVSAVEVLENHQPIRALENIAFSDKAAINLKLKNSAKARWAGSVKAGAGIPSIYTAETAAMSFRRNFQTLNTLKGNNNGVDVTTETANHSITEKQRLDEKGNNIADYITIAPSTISDVNTLFGNNESFSTNFLNKLSEYSQLKTSLTISNSHHKSERERSVSYYLQDSIIKIIESENSLSRNKKGSADISITTNRKDFYLQNTFKGNLTLNDVSIANKGTYPNKQDATINQQDFNNYFELIKRIGRQALHISSYNGWISKPQELAVLQNDTKINEKISTNAFASNTQISYSFAKGKWNFFTRTKANIYSQRINNKNFGYTNLCLAPRAEYKSGRGLFLSVDLPINYFVSQKRFLISFAANAKQQLSAKLSLSEQFGIGEKQPKNPNFYDGPILNDYRTISYGVNQFLPSSNLYASIAIAYKNPISLFFMNASVYYTINRDPYIDSQYFMDEYLINSWIQQKNQKSALTFTGNASKGFRSGNISLGVSYVLSKRTSMRNNQRIAYRYNTWSTEVKANNKFTNWLSAEYLAKASISSITESNNINWHLNQSARFILSPIRQISLIANGSFLINSDSRLFLLGVESLWKITRKWELSIATTNLLDQKQFLTEEYSSLNFVSTRYKIRPRNLFATICFRF